MSLILLKADGPATNTFGVNKEACQRACVRKPPLGVQQFSIPETNSPSYLIDFAVFVSRKLHYAEQPSL
jgi:hypothetical protein